MTFRHIVLFRVHEGVASSRVSSAVELLRSLESLPGVVSFLVEMSLDSRKGQVLVEDATFVDAGAFVAFRADARHAEVVAELSEIADWWVGDYLE